MSFILVGLGGFLGAISRYGITLFFSVAGFPWPTLLVNVLGCAAIAFLSFTKNPLPANVLLFLIPGFLGAFTTFSAFGLETARLVQSQQWGLAALNVFLNVFLGLMGIFVIYRFFLTGES